MVMVAQKNILVLMDGTWDKPANETKGVVTPSNVAKLAKLLVNDMNLQAVYYDDGVGADAVGLSKLIDGATGLGLNDKIIQGYQFIMQNFIPTANIYLLGFSRGAYTVRYIADFIAHMGLLKIIPNETQAVQFQRINNYFNQYKKLRQSNTLRINSNIAIECRIQLLGVWDTVGELGIPLSCLSSINKSLYEFHDNILHSNVLAGYQALAIDEKRADFVPCLWSSRSGIKQVWFAGSHSDIGGGYITCGLSDITLEWLVNILLQQHNIYLDELKLKAIKPDPFAKLHDSSSVFPFDILATQARVIPEASLLKNSVKVRMEDPHLNYKPDNLPQSFFWV